MKTLTTLIALIFAANLWGQTPELFNYQGIARDNLGVALISQNIGLELTIHSGSAAGPIVYQETHAVTTNQFGLFTTQVGSGTVVSGSMSGISWGTDIYFLEVSMDETGGTSYTAMGTTQLISVPYALHAETADNVTNDQVDDADADPTNELQDISLSGTDLSISNGSTVDMSSLQDGTGTDDQNLTFSGTNLTIEDGNTVDLSSLQDGTGTDDQNISGSGLSGTDLTIGIEGGTSETVDLSSLQDGTGTDDQNLTFSGTNLTIEDGNSVDLSGLGGVDTDWTVSGSDMHSGVSGNVGIGTVTPGSKLDIDGDLQTEHSRVYVAASGSFSGGNAVITTIPIPADFYGRITVVADRGNNSYTSMHTYYVFGRAPWGTGGSVVQLSEEGTGFLGGFDSNTSDTKIDVILTTTGAPANSINVKSNNSGSGWASPRYKVIVTEFNYF